VAASGHIPESQVGGVVSLGGRSPESRGGEAEKTAHQGGTKGRDTESRVGASRLAESRKLGKLKGL